MRPATHSLTPSARLDCDRLFFAAVVALFVGAAVIGLAGIGTAPLDSHEAFVAETAREMAVQGDWVVPTFNAKLRLNKPPLSYWVTACVARVAGALPHVAPWHARLPSVAAGFGLVALTLYIGLRLYDRRVAVTAAALLATSSGYFGYTHDARPDMLYAFWVVAGFAAFVAALGRQRAALPGSAWRAALMWACFGVATLTKGPHLPLFLLAAAVIHLAVTGHGAARIYRLLQPIPGIALMLAIALPWWLVLISRVGLEAVQHSQIAGTLLHARAGGSVDFYYSYEPLLLLLPWLPLAVLGLAGLLRGPGRPRTGVLVVPIVVTLTALSLGAQERLVYVLPLLPLVCLVLAAGLARTSPMIPGDPVNIASLVVIIVQMAVVLAVGCWYFIAHPATAAAAPLAAVMTAGVVAAGTMLAARTRRRAAAALAATLVMTVVLWPTLAATELLWGAERFAKIRLARAVNAAIPAEVPLVAYHTSGNVFVYYTGRPIEVTRDFARLAPVVAASPSGRAGMLTTGAQLPELRAAFGVTEIDRMKNGGNNIVLVAIEKKAAR